MDKARPLLREKRLVAETDSKHVIIPNSDKYSEGKKGMNPGGGDLGPALSKGLSETCVHPRKTWGHGDLVGDESEGRAPGQESAHLGVEPLTHPPKSSQHQPVPATALRACRDTAVAQGAICLHGAFVQVCGDVLWLGGHLGRVLKEGAQRDGGQLWGRALPLTRAGGSEQRRDTSAVTLAAQWRTDHRPGTGVGHLGGGGVTTLGREDTA